MTNAVVNVTVQTHLLLNAVVNPGGYLLVEILDAAGNGLAGFTRVDALSFEGSSTYHLATWRDQPNLGALTGQAVRFRFFLRRATLYAFRLAHPNARTSDLLAGIC